jgi:uncharacterized protein YbbC (DUF1343 family)
LKILTAALIIIFNFLPAVLQINKPVYSHAEGFKLGNEVLLSQRKDLLAGKRVAIVTNTTGVLSDGTSIVDAFHNSGAVNVVKIFSPEHGFRGDDSDYDYVDAATGIPVVSLYGNKKKPSAGDLADVDVIVYDIQDVGARFYTFISTMYYCMQAASESGKKFIVCDRPVIPYAGYVDGFVLEDDVRSFIGMLNIPIAYGMTCGELAAYINAEELNSSCPLDVVMMNGYKRDTDYTSLGLSWVKPSPSMYFPSTAVTYQGTCLFEGTNFAEGRGSEKPFEYVGAPYCNGGELKAEMDKFGFHGVSFESIEFIPSTITSPSNPPKYVGEKCGGVYINVTDKKTFQAVKVGIALMVSLKKLYPDFVLRKDNFIDKLSGTKNFRSMVNSGASYEEIIASYTTGLEQFKTRREKYLMY